MKNYRTWLVIVLALIVINSAALALMWLKHREHPPIPRGMPAQQGIEPKDVLIKELAFTPKQAVLFDTMRVKHRRAVNKLEDNNRKLRDSLFANIKKPKADTALINAIAKKISDNQAIIEKITLYHFRELRGILTSEQQVKFDGIIDQVLHMMGGSARGHRPPEQNNDAPAPPSGNDRIRDPRDRPHRGRPEKTGERPDDRFGPPPNGVHPPPPPGDDRRGHRPPPPGDRPPGPEGGPPHDGPPPNDMPPPAGITPSRERL